MIFISYRREDTKAEVTNLHRRLTERYGASNVFVDYQDIPPGQRWPDVLRQELEKRSVVLAVVGASWGNARFTSGKHKGRLKLDDPDDWVRLEICTGIRRGKHVVVIPIDNANLPETEWQCELDQLGTLQHARIRNQSDFDTDFESLCVWLERQVPNLKPTKGAEPPHLTPFLTCLSTRFQTHDGWSSEIAPLVYQEVRSRDRLKLSTSFKCARTLTAIRTSENFLGPIRGEAGTDDWQDDFPQMAAPVLIMVARSFKRSGHTLALISSLCEVLAGTLPQRVIWPSDPRKSNRLRSKIYDACRTARKLDDPDVVIALRSITLAPP